MLFVVNLKMKEIHIIILAVSGGINRMAEDTHLGRLAWHEDAPTHAHQMAGNISHSRHKSRPLNSLLG